VPALADVRAAAHRAERLTARRQRRIRLVLVAGVSGSSPLGLCRSPRASIPLHARPAGEWTYGLQISPPPGWQINSHVVGVDQEYLQLTTQPRPRPAARSGERPSTPQRLRPTASPIRERLGQWPPRGVLRRRPAGRRSAGRTGRARRWRSAADAGTAA
jgi:hypothetical protein